MRQSQLFTKTKKETPKDETARSAQLLLRAGFVHKELAGVYSFLPLGLRVVNRIVAIIREEMQSLGAVELEMSSLQDPNIWKKTDRWSDAAIDVWFKTKLKNDTEIGLALTHEDPLTNMLRDYISSYRDLPRFIYQFQTKFRNELRAKSGVLRTREFLMKDMYSFTTTKEGLESFYEKAAQAYVTIFKRVGIGDRTYRTFASGGAFSKFSDEFQTLCPTGEDTIYLAKDKSMAVNKEVFNDEVLGMFKRSKDDFEEQRAIEVGNIFKLGTRYSEPLGLLFTDEQGKQQPVIMGSYGIGIGRLLATIVEVFADDNGMIWPASVAPFDVHVVELNPKKDAAISTGAEKLVKELESSGKEVLHDDRDLSPGQKFADSDLIGIPVRVVVSEKTMKAGTFEVKERNTGEVVHMTMEELGRTT